MAYHVINLPAGRYTRVIPRTAHSTHSLHPQTYVVVFRSLEQAFKELNGLMAKAAEMVELAERFRTTMAAQKKAAQQEGEGAQPTDPDAQQWMDSEMQAELVHMGIASPVTKAETGARYHQELARQVILTPLHHDLLNSLRMSCTSTSILAPMRCCVLNCNTFAVLAGCL